jgi:hypothetical protein
MPTAKSCNKPSQAVKAAQAFALGGFSMRARHRRTAPRNNLIG